MEEERIRQEKARTNRAEKQRRKRHRVSMLRKVPISVWENEGGYIPLPED